LGPSATDFGFGVGDDKAGMTEAEEGECGSTARGLPVVGSKVPLALGPSTIADR